MCSISRAVNAGVPSGSRARSSRITPSDPGLIDSRPVSASAVRSSRVEPVPIVGKAVAPVLEADDPVVRDEPQPVDHEQRRSDDRDHDDRGDEQGPG